MADSTNQTEPFDQPVQFDVTLDCVEYEGYWVARTIETGVVGGWFTHGEAEDKAALANVALVKAIKEDGRVALDTFFDGHGMHYRIASWFTPVQSEDGTTLDYETVKHDSRGQTVDSERWTLIA